VDDAYPASAKAPGTWASARTGTTRKRCRGAGSRLLPGGAAAQIDQVLYNLATRDIEWDLLPSLREHRLPVMAYSPFDEGKLLRHRGLVAFAKQHAMTPSQAALAWLLAQDGVIAIPKTGNRERLRENVAALEHRLTAAHLRELDALFPPPRGPSPLAMI
jgi:aldehyde reductase